MQKYADFVELEPIREQSRFASHGMREYTPIKCPHCEIVFVKVPTSSIKTNKAFKCMQHLTTCTVFNPPAATTEAQASVLEGALAKELRILREEREVESARHDAEREVAEQRHDELMAELTGVRSQLSETTAKLTDVQAQLSHKRQCLTDVREWGKLAEPDNTLVPQLTYREMQLLLPFKSDVKVLKRENALLQSTLNEKAPAALVKKAAEAYERVRKAEEGQKEAESELVTRMRAAEATFDRLSAENALLKTRPPEIVYRLPKKLMRSAWVRKHAMVAFAPEKQTDQELKNAAAALFQQVSEAQPDRSSGFES